LSQNLGPSVARRVPYLNVANGFTFLRVALVPVFAWLLLVRRPPATVLAAVVFAVAAASDGVDGWVARRFQLVSGFGVFLDQLADKLLIGTALVALALASRIPAWAVAAILTREFAIVGLRVAFARTNRAMPASRAGKTKTGAQIVAVLLLTLRPAHDGLALAFLYLAVVLTVASGVDYFIDAMRGRAAEDWT
jgi:CDP-diacylglycerol--glycerol-3-phosphate 3-phosphatidyltransferase